VIDSSAPLSAIGLHFTYGHNPFLRNIDMFVMEGEMIGIVGPNGAGKTTLLNLLSGTLSPERGSVLVYGENLTTFRPRERSRRVAVVPQNSATPSGFTALEVVVMGRNPHLSLFQWEGPEDLAICRRMMEFTGTWEFADRPLLSLSGGEKQRVFIARALVQEAPVLLLDEPTAHLDIGYQSIVMDIVSNIIVEAKVTVVAAMHDLSLAAQYCDRLILLNQGTIIAKGSPKEVLTTSMVSAVFGASVALTRHPTYGTPVVLPVRQSPLIPDHDGP
jgi:iron complex transport system ATP-binding protein